MNASAMKLPGSSSKINFKTPEHLEAAKELLDRVIKHLKTA